MRLLAEYTSGSRGTPGVSLSVVTLSFAVIPTHNRPVMLGQLVGSLDGLVDVVIVVDNASEQPVMSSDFPLSPLTTVSVIRDEEQPPNLYRLWNVAFDLAENTAGLVGAERWNVSVFNDDTELPSGWFTAVGDALRAHPSAVIACGSQFPTVREPLLKTAPDGDLRTRMTPHAFTMRGESCLRADESMRWWYGDTDLDWQARLSGGVLLIPGFVASNRLANSTTVGELAEQAGRDSVVFRDKWGRMPW